MKVLKFLLVGIFFGIVLVKSEAVSWYRIYEMFKFQSFHMYGIIGSAVFLGALLIWLFKKYGVKNIGQLNVKNANNTTFQTTTPFDFDEIFITVEDQGDQQFPEGMVICSTKI